MSQGLEAHLTRHEYPNALGTPSPVSDVLIDYQFKRRLPPRACLLYEQARESAGHKA
jgi:hypothetical protein